MTKIIKARSMGMAQLMKVVNKYCSKCSVNANDVADNYSCQGIVCKNVLEHIKEYIEKYYKIKGK